MKDNNINSRLLFLAELMDMDILTKKTIGFVTVMKVDTNTFTLSEVDKVEFANALPGGLVDELTTTESSQ